MKIALFVNNVDQIGGAEIATCRLAEHIARNGHRVILLGTQAISLWLKHGTFYDYANRILTIRLPIWQRSQRTFARTLIAQALWSFPFLLRGTQILHLRGLTPETITLSRIARHLRIKTLCVPMASGAYGDVSRFPTTQPHDAQAFDWISALTEPLRDEVIGWGYPARQTSVIPNAVDIDSFTTSTPQCVDPYVIFVGQFRPEKRVDLLLRAWQQVQLVFPHARLTLVGGGRNLPVYQELAAQLDIKATFVPNTHPTGVFARLRANSIFVQPGISEGMSNALLEAMAAGLAPVVSDTPANLAVITPEIDGLAYQADSAEGLVAQLTRLITDSELRARLGAAARQTVIQRFDLDHVTDQYLGLYARLLGETP